MIRYRTGPQHTFNNPTFTGTIDWRANATIWSSGMTWTATIPATSSFNFPINWVVNVIDGTGSADIGGTSFLYTATASNPATTQFRNIALQTFINTPAGTTGALALATDEFVSLGPTGGQDTGNLTALVVHRAHYSNKSTNASPQEITTGYTFWASGVDVNDVGATGTVKTNVALNISDQGDTSRTGAAKSKVYRDTHGIRITDFTEGAITSAGLTSELTSPSVATSTAITPTISSSVITIGGSITGTFYPGQTLTATGIPGDTQIASQSSGTPGGAGDYVLTRVATGSAVVAATAQVTKLNLNLTGTAPNIITGAIRQGDTTLPQVPGIDGHYAPGTLAANATTANQFIYTYTAGAGGGSSQPTAVLHRLIAAGSISVALDIATQHQVDLGITGGTTTTAIGARSFVQTTNTSGTPVTTNAYGFSSVFKAGGVSSAGATVTNLNLYNVETISFSTGSDTITTVAGLRINDIGHASRVATAIGVDISDFTVSSVATVGIRSVMNTGTAKTFISHTGTAPSTFGGIVTFPAAASNTTASIRLPHGTAPASPVNGDMWTTTSGLFVRINGSTVGPLS